jgi:3-oxoadipate enol-lactonase
MPKIRINNLDHYYEQTAGDPPLVLIHGAFADVSMWDPQWQFFANKHQLLRYDLRGHGRTGPSTLQQYTIDTFADDLATLLESLAFHRPVICGQSFGGVVAQALAVHHPGSLRGLILSSSMVAIDLTLMDKLLCNVIFPKWAMLLAIRLLTVKRYVLFSLWLGRLTKGKQFLSNDPARQDYLQQCMLDMESHEYLKIWSALYNFHLLPLERITCPTLVLNGELEPKGMFAHSQTILRLVPQANAEIIPAVHHASNMDNPQAFNRAIQAFLDSID